MEERKLLVHGSIFFLLRKYIVHLYSDEVWAGLRKAAGIEGYEYLVTESYPIEHLNGIVGEASRHSGSTVHELKEKFGEFLVPDLFALYKNYLRPEWKTFDVIEHTERVMHGAVRNLNSTATPPILHVTRVNHKLLIIDYHSERKMGSLALGIIRGIAVFYNESERVTVRPMSDPEDARVQVRVEFS